MSELALNVKKRVLPYSSLFFLIPCGYAHIYEHSLVSYILFSLVSTSVLYHSYDHTILFWMDQIAVYLTVMSSFFYGYQGGIWIFLIPSVGNLWNTYVFWYGYKTKTMCFHPNYFTSELWHSTIHIISSVSYLGVLYFISQPPRLLESSPV